MITKIGIFKSVYNEIKILIILILIISSEFLTAQPKFSDYNSMSGAFSRMGFGSRGMSMGNSISAVIDGNLVSYYNPALSAFQDGNYFQTSYSFLSLDRSLNFLNFTKKFEIGKNKSNNGKPRSTAGISIGVINAGVGNIDGTNSQGEKFATLSTSENQFFVSFSNRFSEKVSVGVGLKFFYYKLYKEITSSGLGFDLGLLYKFNENLNLALVVTDINSKYKWDTNSIYGIDGNTTTGNFPLLIKIGSAYKFANPNLITSVEIEFSDSGTNFLRVGAEYNIIDNLNFRAGLDKISLSNFDIPFKPALGFSYWQNISNYIVGFNYAFVIEPYSSYDIHVIGIEFKF